MRVAIIATDPTGRPIFQIDGLKIRRVDKISSPTESTRRVEHQGVRSTPAEIIEEIVCQTGAARQKCVLRLIRSRVAEILESPVNEVPMDQPLDTLGLDSLMAFELREEIKQSIGVEVSLEVFLQDITLWDLSATLTDELNVRMGKEGDHPSRDLFPSSSEQGEGLIEGAI